MINQKRLKEFLLYNEDGYFTWIAYKRNIKVGDIAGRTKPNGYCEVAIDGKLYSTHRLVWLYFYGQMPSDEIDHIDGNPTNNRVENLREATRAQNSYNRGMQRNNTTGFKGVRKEKGLTWSACIWVNGKNKRLGSFYSPELAHEAYKKAAEELHGDFANDGS